MNAPKAAHQTTHKSTHLSADHFSLLGITPAYALDDAALSAAYQALQQTVHPDRFTSANPQASDADKRAAMQSSAQVNEAYKTLRDPLTRAAYLCELKGAAVKAERHTAMPPAFLMQQLEWREALAQAQQTQDEAAIEKLQTIVVKARRDGYAALAYCLDIQHDYAAASQQVRTLMFIDKFSRDVSDALDALHV
jgi:molecular chaperone HscB